MKSEQAKRLKKIEVEMRAMYENLEKAHRQGKQTEKLDEAVGDLLCDFENDFGIPAFVPEVPAETVQMFFKLSKLAGVATNPLE